jgi:hypothetical protein
MKKEVKIILYCVLGIVLILVLCLMIWWRKHNAWEPDVLPEELYNETEVENTKTENQPSQNSEQDILDDLESLFHSNDGYENVEWEYGFINAES